MPASTAFQEHAPVESPPPDVIAVPAQALPPAPVESIAPANRAPRGSYQVWQRVVGAAGVLLSGLSAVSAVSQESLDGACSDSLRVATNDTREQSSGLKLEITDQATSALGRTAACRVTITLPSTTQSQPSQSRPEEQISRYERRPEPETPEAAKLTLSEKQLEIINSKRFLSPAKKEFLGEIVLAMMELGPTEDINRLAVIAKAMLESGWGAADEEPDSEAWQLVWVHHNIFGMKYWGKPGDVSTGPIGTQEDDGSGNLHGEQASFLSFTSYRAAIERYRHDISTLKRYRSATPHFDRPTDNKEQALARARDYVRGVIAGGYATDTKYEPLLMNLITLTSAYELLDGTSPLLPPGPEFVSLDNERDRALSV